MIPVSHPLIGPSLRRQLDFLEGGWLRAHALAHPSIDFADELISQCASLPQLLDDGGGSRDGIRTCWDSLRRHDGTTNPLLRHSGIYPAVCRLLAQPENALRALQYASLTRSGR